MLRGVALARTDVLKGRIASIISVTRIGEQGTLAVTKNRSRLKRNADTNTICSHLADSYQCDNGGDMSFRNNSSYRTHTT
jgi:hypothetical protein